MLEQLQIKCPLCGIVLEVRNSRSEAFKQIVCPNCHKHLSVDFRDTPTPLMDKPLGAFYYGKVRYLLTAGVNSIPLLPSENVEVRVVPLADGSSKCIVRILDLSGRTITVNGQQLHCGDEIVLMRGDELQVDDTMLTFDKEQVERLSMEGQSTTVHQHTEHPDEGVAKGSNGKRWIAFCAAVIVLGLVLLAYLLWPTAEKGQPSDQLVSPKVETVNDSQDKVAPVNTLPKQAQKQKEDIKTTPQKQKDASPSSSPAYHTMSDYELEQHALRGEAIAQYELGCRWVNKKDSINVVKGVKYLRRAAQNGSSEARGALQVVNRSLKQAAASGNSHAQNLLEVIASE